MRLDHWNVYDCPTIEFLRYVSQCYWQVNFQLPLLQGLRLNYFGDLTGGGFLISTPEQAESCACGSGFRFF